MAQVARRGTDVPRAETGMQVAIWIIICRFRSKMLRRKPQSPARERAFMRPLP